ncbi:MAG: hypothetical protein IT457_24430 [Planctomycetes bacterium]|nr:hypothetical protein [Planctomycetota bacterium]
MIRAASAQESAIRAVSFAFLCAVLTVLAAIGAWAGLQAWPRAAARVATPTQEAELRAALPAPPRGPLPRVLAAAEASFEVRARPASAALRLELLGDPGADGDGALVVTLLDARSGARIASRPLGSARGALEFEAVPNVAIVAALHAATDSPRHGWLSRAAIPAAEGTGPRAAQLDVTRTRVRVRLQSNAVDADERWSCVVLGLTRVDVPDWGGGSSTTIATGFARGQSELELELGPLGPGRYALSFGGFTPEPATPGEFAVPATSQLEIRGRPQ